MTRREILKQMGLSTLIPVIHNARATPNQQQTPVSPTDAQKKWMDLKFGLFIHFGINSYYDVEWSDGTLDPSKFNPVELDTDQWCFAARKAGMKYIVVVTKHHDGFCNWPSRHTDYSISASPFQKDFLAEVVRAARKYDLAVGFYYSLWDRHQKTHDTDEWKYVAYMKDQLHELLTNYGPIVELWFDGFWKKQQSGWTKQEEISGENISRHQERDTEFIAAWRMEGAYRWQMDHLYQYIKSIQPGCLVMNNSTTAYPGVPLHPVDIRSGEKATRATHDNKVWTFLGKQIFLPLQIETTLSIKGDARFPSGNWFWHEWDHSVASKEQVMNWQRTARQLEANLLVNVGPMANGKLRPEDEALLHSLG